MHTMMPSRIASGHTIELLVNCHFVVACLKYDCRFNLNMVSFLIALMATPKSINVFGIDMLLMFKVTTGLLRLTYLGF